MDQVLHFMVGYDVCTMFETLTSLLGKTEEKSLQTFEELGQCALNEQIVEDTRVLVLKNIGVIFYYFCWNLRYTDKYLCDSVHFFIDNNYFPEVSIPRCHAPADFSNYCFDLPCGIELSDCLEDIERKLGVSFDTRYVDRVDQFKPDVFSCTYETDRFGFDVNFAKDSRNIVGLHVVGQEPTYLSARSRFSG